MTVANLSGVDGGALDGPADQAVSRHGVEGVGPDRRRELAHGAGAALPGGRPAEPEGGGGLSAAGVPVSWCSSTSTATATRGRPPPPC